MRYEFVKEFQQRLFERFPHGYQKWWPKFIFHFSDINNIISVLNSSKLYSRQKAIELGLMINDNANDDVIQNTGDNYKNYVRCYFGAKTPTQYMNEGIKPRNRIRDNAHCPVPVFLLFDFVKLLSREDVKFSSGNVAAQYANVYSDINRLNDLEFNHIYSRGLLPEEGKAHIKYCRHAEVLIPDELDVYEYLKFVCVRSNAEKDTLLYGLNDDAKEKLQGKVKVFTGEGLFEKNELFIKDVQLIKDKIAIYLSKTSGDEFNIRLLGIDLGKSKKFDTLLENEVLNASSFSWYLKGYDVGEKGLLFSMEIDGNLVYKNVLSYAEEEELF